MKKILSKIIFWLLGWKVIDNFDFPKKCVIIAAPHTSNWDFVIGKFYSYIKSINGKYLIKSSFFTPILGVFFKWDGGIPVYRDSSYNVVDQIVKKFSISDNLILVIAPEGTRSRVKRWKTGFYYIAHKANVPIILLAMDYEKKRVGVINSVVTTGDIDRDMLFIQKCFKEVKGKVPQNFNPKII